uniref:Ring finger protein 25 n=1 Tax=Plectus sambesii TaxID=2011161 RepID=A0A914W9N4_9BILA
MQDALYEIEALQAIFNDELVVDKSNMSSESPSITVQRVVRPAEKTTSDNPAAASLKSSASVLVFIVIDAKYPISSPVVEIRQPRGLTEEDVRCLEAQITSHLQENGGMQIIYDIFQLTQDFLENCHVPGILCSICLAEFSSDTAAVSTECGHFFHRHCLGRYLRHCEEETKALLAETPSHMHDTLNTTLTCPVCRAELNGLSLDEIATAGESEDTSADCSWQTAINLEPWRAKQQQLKDVFERQRANGGLIDLDEESKRNLITEETRVVIPIAAVEESESTMPSTSADSEREKEPARNPKQQRHHWRGGRNTHHRSRGAEETRHYIAFNSGHRRPHKAPRNDDGRGTDNS